MSIPKTMRTQRLVNYIERLERIMLHMVSFKEREVNVPYGQAYLEGKLAAYNELVMELKMMVGMELKGENEKEE